MLDQKDIEQIGKVLDSKLALSEERIGKSVEDRIGKSFDAKFALSEERIGKSVEDRVGKSFDAKFALSEERIGKSFDTKLQASEGRIIVAVGEMIEQQVLPQISALDDKVSAMDGKVSALEGTIANLPDKAYLDDKLADLNGEFVRRDKQTNKKIDSTIDLLHVKGTFTKEDVRHIHQVTQMSPAT